MSFVIRQTDLSDLDALYSLYAQCGKEDAGYFEACFEKDCILLIVAKEQEDKGAPHDIGFGILNFEPKYALYQKLEIPEIQDVNVIPDARQQGAASALLEAFEALARDQGAAQVGISVGLDKSFGAAQRLYVKRGYVPDGYGITYDREGVEQGRRYPMDDNLALMMVKTL